MPKKPAHQNKQLCGQPKPGGAPCERVAGWGTPHLGSGACRSHGGSGGPPEGNQNAVGHGAPLGNQNARTHGLFSRVLGDFERPIYEAAKGVPADELARDTAEFLVAKVVGAYRSDEDWTKARGLVGQVLRALVEDGQIDQFQANALMDRLSTPDLATLGKALGPLKGLLEVKKAKEREAEGKALGALLEAITRSKGRRDAEGSEGEG